ncbi:hypothetical protein OG21DRAFT_1527079 [Imleria badia]|nr:hypothetical protein OG21DRAFT_1527079 [Imleria badia]
MGTWNEAERGTGGAWREEPAGTGERATIAAKEGAGKGGSLAENGMGATKGSGGTAAGEPPPDEASERERTRPERGGGHNDSLEGGWRQAQLGEEDRGKDGKKEQRRPQDPATKQWACENEGHGVYPRHQPQTQKASPQGETLSSAYDNE